MSQLFSEKLFGELQRIYREKGLHGVVCFLKNLVGVTGLFPQAASLVLSGRSFGDPAQEASLGDLLAFAPGVVVLAAEGSYRMNDSVSLSGMLVRVPGQPNVLFEVRPFSENRGNVTINSGESESWELFWSESSDPLKEAKRGMLLIDGNRWSSLEHWLNLWLPVHCF
ncbi:MAG: hypothetical protein ABIJ46_04210 [bacterium]